MFVKLFSFLTFSGFYIAANLTKGGFFM